jgi:hypothetical protein
MENQFLVFQRFIFFKDIHIHTHTHTHTHITYIYEYSVADFRDTRRGHQIPLQMVVSYHVVTGN